MLPLTFEEFFGQEHIVGKGTLLRRMIESDTLTSLILFGPPGSGKTSLAHLIANLTNAIIERLNAVTSGVGDIRKIVERSKKFAKLEKKATILFVDEIHRWSKVQQDALLPDVEDGNIILIGVTVYNPFFSIIPGLVSRSHIFELKPLSLSDIEHICRNALKDRERGLGNLNVVTDKEPILHICRLADGDARKALNALEIGVLSTTPNEQNEIVFDMKVAEESIQKKGLYYTADEHYDTISAFIKSMRGSDIDASIYWLAKMIHAGEDPRFIARRIVICAAEDVGNADPNALLIANAALNIVESIGMPEAKIPLAEATIYVASAPKSNACYEAISKALEDMEKTPTQQIPPSIQEGGYKGAEKLGRGKDYKYPHLAPNGWVDQNYLLERKVYYTPTSRGFEKTIRERIKNVKKKR